MRFQCATIGVSFKGFFVPRDKTGHFYYEWFPTIYRADTQSLTLAEDGAYRRLLDHYMETKQPLPNDDRALARIVGVGVDEWNSIKNPVLSYFKPSTNPVGFLCHYFCDELIKKHASRIDKAKSNGKNGGRPKSLTQNNNNPVGLENKTQQKAEQNRTEHNTFTKVKDADALFWESCRDYLGANKSSLIGKWVKDYGKGAVFEAVSQAQKNNPADPVTYIAGILRGKQQPLPKGEKPKMNVKTLTKADLHV